jgi:cbb3-type cytochrome oxidase maturation protein
MSVIYIVLPLALLFAASAVVAFFLAVKSGQFDDLDTPPQRVPLPEDGPLRPSPQVKTSTPASGRFIQ